MKTRSPMPRRQPPRLAFYVGFAAALCLAVGCENKEDAKGSASPNTASTSPNTSLDKAIALIQQGQGEAAMKVLRGILIESPQNAQALNLAMQIHAKRGQYCEAADIAVQLAGDEASKVDEFLIKDAFYWHFQCKNYEAAESDLRRALELAPQNVQAHRLLAQLLSEQGRRIESSAHVRELIRLKAIQHHELLSLIDLRGPFRLVDYGNQIDRERSPLFKLGNARALLARSRTDQKELLTVVQDAWENSKSNSAVSAFYGMVMARNDQATQFENWLKEVPDGIENEAEYWNAIGHWLSRQDQHKSALRAFSEALLRDPTDRDSLREMIAAMSELGKSSEAQTLRDRLAELDKIFRISRDADAEQARWISDKLQELGRPWESLGWLIHSYDIAGQVSQAIDIINQRHAVAMKWEASAKTGQIARVRRKQLLGLDAARWPLPKLDTLAQDQGGPAETNRVTRPIKLNDRAAAWQLSFQYQAGFPFDQIDSGKPEAKKSNLRPHHINGGGIAVLDFDLDGLPDTYFSQAGGTVNANNSGANPLLRNFGDHFERVPSAGADDRGYGQGVSSADLNQDGFPDLLVANAGTNSAYINQGDGTFRKADGPWSSVSNVWSTGHAVADLSGDGLPEIIEVNYVDDEKAYTDSCQGTCPSPQNYTAASDLIFHCPPDGQFQPWKTLPKAPSRLGLGVVVANFDRQHGNDVFIANDGDFNHFWSSTHDESGADKYTMVETANVRGCSIGRNGASQACMGVAAGDMNRDGQLDLHVTNYYLESVNLFTQNSPGFFSDEARKLGLHDASFQVLGFGTQSADLDHDGWADLVVLNGHVNDERESKNIPFQMTSQVFQGGPRGFVQIDADSLGNAWQEKSLGRTLALIDANQDGRMDFLANYLDRPAALLVNETETGAWIQVELIGTKTERDAIGTEIKLNSGKESWTAWQTAGDGYMCTNESVLHLGLGDIQTADELLVTWPSGQSQMFKDVKLNQRLLIVEGQSQPFPRTIIQD